MSYPLASLPAKYQRQAEHQLMQKNVTMDNVLISDGKQEQKKERMTKTEQRFEREVLLPMVDSGELKRYQFEGVSFDMKNGHRYTPDFEACDGTRMVCFEVKGSYKLGSYQRARLAFDQCKVERPWIVWRWFEINEYGLWVEK